MPQDISTLRKILFDQLNRLAEAGEDDIEVELRKTAGIVQVSDNILRSAEVENQFISITQATGSGFIPVTKEQKDASEANIKNITVAGKPLFNPDKESNWLIDDGKVIAPPRSGIEKGSFGKVD